MSAINFEKLKAFEKSLEDVMDLSDASVIKEKITDAEAAYENDHHELNKLKLGILYCGAAQYLPSLKNQHNGYAEKSFIILTELYTSSTTTKELLPFIAAYRASALSLATSKKLASIRKSFKLFEQAVAKYGSVSYLPEFMRGNMAMSLPWFYFTKKKQAKRDFQSIMTKHSKNEQYANWKVLNNIEFYLRGLGHPLPSAK